MARQKGLYEGEYVKLSNDPTFWLVKDGKRIALKSQADWWHYGNRPINIVNANDLDAIPVASEEQQEEEDDDDEDDGPIVTGAEDDGFLTVVTRHTAGREDAFAVCCESLGMQTDQDFQHLVIIDTVGHGIGWSHLQFAKHAELANGEYVFILDDDDCLITDDFVSSVKQEAEAALLVVRMDHKWAILPSNEDWNAGCPRLGRIGISAVVVRRDVWVEAVNAFTTAYAGDYPFLARCFEIAGDDIVWIDRVMSRCQ